MSKINRQLSIHFFTKGLKGIFHDEVLSEIGKIIDIEDVLSIQITEKDCIVTLKKPETKDRLAAQGIALRDRSIIFYEIIRFGKVVPGSIKRGVIKGTNIENGSRYIDILECDSVLPNRTSFGRFEVRLFADNNRTPCIYCHITGHPSYRCKDKPSLMNQKRCYNCCGIGHIANACTSEGYCSYCNVNGHARRDCEQYKQETEKKELGSYGPEILEGRQDNTKNIHTDEDDKESISSVNANGASNCIRLGHIDDSLVNASISGGSFDKIEQNIDLAFQKTGKQRYRKCCYLSRHKRHK
ncbi:CNBP [Mytilus edulis]|uniref:CNBP n=1 Tax=Mytilus edulis TaxID=6550 RepID=A0A8S3UYA3_MYTED|nr:CNBP [Mytilus edulis]